MVLGIKHKIKSWNLLNKFGKQLESFESLETNRHQP